MQFETAKKTEKVSDRIIDQIRDAVLSGRLKPGDRLASEKDLIVQFGVSKATMREALRVLEAMGLVEIRKGLGGGAFITEVGMKTTVHSIINFLHFKSVSIREITMLRFMLEPAVAYMAANAMEPEDLAKLRSMIEGDAARAETELAREISFHRYLVRMSRNPILILIMDFIDSILTEVKSQLNLGEDFYGKVRNMHRRILACLEQHDAAGARREIIQDLLAVGNHLSDLTDSRRFEPSELGYDPDCIYRGGTGSEQGMIPESGTALRAPKLDPQLMEALSQEGVLFQTVGSGLLYLLVNESPDEQELES